MPATAIIATDVRVIIIKLGSIFTSAAGSQVASYRYEEIRAVDLRSQLASGYVEITAAGTLPVGLSREVTGKAIQETAAQASNAYLYAKYIKGKSAQAQHIVEVIRQQMAIHQAARHLPQQAKPSSQPVTSIPDQIRQLAALRDAGILTNEEFETKKNELLSRM